MSFANTINRLLAKKGLTQADLARELGVSRQAVQFWASGRSEPKGANLIKFTDMFGGELPEIEQTFYRNSDGDSAETSDDWVKIPVVDSYASCGGGSDPGSELFVSTIEFLKTFLMGLSGVTGTSKMHLIPSIGDSMEPTISRNALCLIDGNQTTIRDDGIYCIQAENSIFIKRIMRNLDGSITLISDNDSYPVQHISKEVLSSAKVMGKVVYILNGKLA